MLLAPYKHLKSVVEGLSAVTNVIGPHIYRDIAPAGQVPPYCVISAVGLLEDSSALNMRRGNTIWQIKFIGKRSEGLTLRTMAEAVATALHETTPGVVDDVSINVIKVDQAFDYIERDGSEVYQHSGYRFQVMISK